jgi:DNA-binding NtrC family response regulator
MEAVMRRVLVVEDDPYVYEAIQAAFLLKGGFDVAHAGDGETALAKLEGETPDVALIDYGLPKVSGIAIAERAAGRKIPVILMSGYGDVVAQSHRFPMLPKPFRVTELVDRFEEVVAEAARLTNMARQEIEKGQALVTKASALQASFADWVRLRDQMMFTKD